MWALSELEGVTPPSVAVKGTIEEFLHLMTEEHPDLPYRFTLDFNILGHILLGYVGEKTELNIVFSRDGSKIFLQTKDILSGKITQGSFRRSGIDV